MSALEEFLARRKQEAAAQAEFHAQQEIPTPLSTVLYIYFKYSRRDRYSLYLDNYFYFKQLIAWIGVIDTTEWTSQPVPDVPLEFMTNELQSIAHILKLPGADRYLVDWLYKNHTKLKQVNSAYSSNHIHRLREANGLL